MSELVASTTTEEWRIRIQKPGQRTLRFLTTGGKSTFASKEDAQAHIDAIKDGFTVSSLGIQWRRITVESGEVDWVHNRP